MYKRKLIIPLWKILTKIYVTESSRVDLKMKTSVVSIVVESIL